MAEVILMGPNITQDPLPQRPHTADQGGGREGEGGEVTGDQGSWSLPLLSLELDLPFRVVGVLLGSGISRILKSDRRQERGHVKASKSFPQVGGHGGR